MTEIHRNMNLNSGEITFLFFIALIVVVHLIRLFYYYRILLKLLSKQPEEIFKLSNVKKYKLLFPKDWFENEELEYRRVQAREALNSAAVFLIGFAMVFYMMAFHGK